MPRAVRFDHYGGSDVLQIVEVDRPHPGPGEVVVRAVVAATNPGELMIRQGAFADAQAQADSAPVWEELADLVVAGELTIPIRSVYPLERVRDAYDELAARHTRGKIV